MPACIQTIDYADTKACFHRILHYHTVRTNEHAQIEDSLLNLLSLSGVFANQNKKFVASQLFVAPAEVLTNQHSLNFKIVLIRYCTVRSKLKTALNNRVAYLPIFLRQVISQYF